MKANKFTNWTKINSNLIALFVNLSSKQNENFPLEKTFITFRKFSLK